MLIAFISLLNGTSPGTCLLRATAAFLVFAGFGLILRYALTADPTDTQAAGENAAGLPGYAGNGHLDMIVPGTSVAELLAHEPAPSPDKQEEAA
jgi:hypothetical protein